MSSEGNDRRGAPDVLLTFDIDWAPDFAIDFVAEQLARNRVRSTWFVTHLSPAIERLRAYPGLFELGIHPNFLPGSSHGKTTGEVLDHCLQMVPEAISLRTHCLYQSTPLLCEIMRDTPIMIDGSLYLPHARDLSPTEYHWNGHRLLRIPHFWEDDFEMERATPVWEFNTLLKTPGLKVFDFHPVHVYLNSTTAVAYDQLKTSAIRLSEASQQVADSLVQPGNGPRSLLTQAIDHLQRRMDSLRMRDLHDLWCGTPPDVVAPVGSRGEI